MLVLYVLFMTLTKTLIIKVKNSVFNPSFKFDNQFLMTLDMCNLKDFFEGELKHLEAIYLKSVYTTSNYFLKVGIQNELVIELKCI